MKTIVLLLLAVFALGACDKTKDKEGATSNTAAATKKKEAEVIALVSKLFDLDKKYKGENSQARKDAVHEITM